MQAILARRRQLQAMLVAESNRAQMAPEALARRIRAHIRWLEKELERTDRDLDEAIASSSAFAHNEALLRSVPGVGPVLARTLLAELPENWGRLPISACVPWWEWLPSTTIPVRERVSGRCGVGGHQ